MGGVLGVTPQALRYRPLRGLSLRLCARVLGLTPQALRYSPLRGLRRVLCGRVLALSPQALRYRPLRGLNFRKTYLGSISRRIHKLIKYKKGAVLPQARRLKSQALTRRSNDERILARPCDANGCTYLAIALRSSGDGGTAVAQWFNAPHVLPN